MFKPFCASDTAGIRIEVTNWIKPHTHAHIHLLPNIYIFFVFNVKIGGTILQRFHFHSKDLRRQIIIALDIPNKNK